jgi:hypothetical protein
MARAIIKIMTRRGFNLLFSIETECSGLVIAEFGFPFYPPSQKAPPGRAGMNAKRVSAVALAKVDLLRRVPPKT